MTYSIHIITDFMGLQLLEVWSRLQDNLSNRLDEHAVVRLEGRKVALNRVTSRLEKWNKSHFDLSVDEGEISYSHVWNRAHSFIEMEGLVGTPADAESWVSPFFDSPTFMQSWVYDSVYSYWQNAFDPLQYTSEGRNFDDLPMKSNGLPFPLEQRIIDTSNNPGRRVIRNGYVEAVGGTMWIGPMFMEKVGLSIDALREASWLNLEELPNGILKISTPYSVFDSDEGEQRRVQEDLRDILYGNAAKNNA
ncbi:hypothetical protein KQI84_15845 [bacterium]|nr:hypothetical protein [bacterium]